MDIDAFKQQFDVDNVAAQYTCSEIKAALAQNRIVLLKKFSDPCDKNKVDTLVAIIKGNPLATMLLYNYLNSVASSRPSNPFDASTLIPTSVNTYEVGPESIMYRKEVEGKPSEREQVTVPFKGGVWDWTNSGKTDVDCTAIKIMYAPISTFGQESKAKVAAKPDALAVNAAIAQFSAQTNKFVGRPEDAMLETLKTVKNASPSARTAIRERIAMFVPMENNLPLTSFKGQKVSKWQKTYNCIAMSAESFRSQLDRMMSNIPRKGQGKFAREAYLGVPLSDLGNLLAHKITLDDAGFHSDQSLYVHTTDTALVHFLRSNYGPRVVGSGIEYPMLPSHEIKGKKFDAIYIPDPFKAAAGGDLFAVLKKIRAEITEKFKITCHGKLIAYITPLVLYDRTYENLFFEAAKSISFESDLRPVHSVKEANLPFFPGEPESHEPYYDLDKVKEVWLPPLVVDDTEIFSLYVTKMIKDKEYTSVIENPTALLARIKDKLLTPAERSSLMAMLMQSKSWQLYYHDSVNLSKTKEQNTLNYRLSSLPTYDKGNRLLTMESTMHAVTSMRLSIDSWKGVLLYSELLEQKQTVASLSSQLITYMRHVLRCLWSCDPMCRDVYGINKIHAATGSLNIDWGGSYAEVMSDSLVKDWNNMMSPQVIVQPPPPMELAESNDTVEEDQFEDKSIDNLFL